MYPTMNFNEVRLENDGNFGDPEYDNSVVTEEVTVFMRNLEDRLIEQIQQADAVFGAVAWLTNKRILKALAEKPSVHIIVQKEDFLRPDTAHEDFDRQDWAEDLRQAYGALKSDLERGEFEGLLGRMSFAGDPDIQPVRCVGNHNADKAPAFPRMHNKFMVFAKLLPDETRDDGVMKIEPYAVWTGSFNMTEHSVMSLENAVLMRNPAIVGAYYKEFQLIAAMSEPLDWESHWVQPEWRIGS